jgi:alpha-beta hydrolase superfamily lysophospholipase
VNEAVEFYSEGLKIAAVLHLPDGADGDVPGVVLCQGLGSTKEINLPAIAERLNAAGIAALAFDYRGWGASEGKRWRLIPEEQVTDIRAGLSFLEGQEGIDPERLGLVGVSTGGSNAVQAAGMDDRAKATVAAVGFGDGERWMRDMRRFWEFKDIKARVAADRKQRARTGESEHVDHLLILVRDPESLAWQQEMVKKFPERIFQLPLETAEGFLEHRPERVAANIAPRALMLVSASEDAIVDPQESQRMYDLAGEPKEHLVLQGVEHHAIYTGEPFDTWTTEAVRFLRQHLAG